MRDSVLVGWLWSARAQNLVGIGAEAAKFKLARAKGGGGEVSDGHGH
jgi:hypothetical protein